MKNPLNDLSDLIRGEKAYAPLCRALRGKTGVFTADGLCDGAFFFLLSALKTDVNRRLLVLTASEKEAREAQSTLSAFFETRYFPARTPSYSPLETHGDDAGAERLSALAALAANEDFVLIATAAAALQKTVPPEKLARATLTLLPGDTLSYEALCRALTDLDFSPADRVEGEGQFSRRGGIVDFFAPGEAPVRVEFFGDEIERISEFDPISQKSTKPLTRARLTPSTELFLTADERAFCQAALEKELAAPRRSAQEKAFLESAQAALESGAQTAPDLFFDLCDTVNADLFSHLPDALCVVWNPERVFFSLDDESRNFNAFLEALAETGAFFAVSPENPYDRARLTARLRGARTLLSAPGGESGEPGELFLFRSRSAPLFGENIDLLCQILLELKSADYRVLIAAQSAFAAENLKNTLLDREIPAFAGAPSDCPDGQVCVFCPRTPAGVSARLSGFDLADRKICLLTESDPQGETAPVRRRKSAVSSMAKRAIDSHSDLNIGDYVVHEAHGIGLYEGIETLLADGVKRDFLKLRYAGGDLLYVPCSNLAPVSKYVGRGADGQIALSHMGSPQWKETKRRAKGAAKELARELVKLYSIRQNSPGYAFSPDSPWQQEFEDNFEFEETPGQLEATREIKRDMESDRPMDRLLCGDVGFGKTEVALRGVFKCVMDGKQAAILAPTTLLCLQHFRTVKARFRGYPVKIEMLSRLCTPKEKARVKEDLKTGACDIVVGTHALLQKDLKFRDLGFLTVDEEQRFGVAHKERLKQISANVDVLTLTATPIPRTLNMALSGVRDLSLLEEAPGDRRPVETFVSPYDEALIDAAIARELGRGGQIFYLINNIERLYGKAASLQSRHPRARVRAAHGRMDKGEIASLWQELSEGKIDLLVCTTIIETGIDLPNANTLIVEHAERLGLSQLHQLRGRVGRSWRKAYAYFTYPANRALPELAEKRLRAIREFTRFGSGFQLAMRDLELRGAGSLLGAEQSGHLEKIGYDLYLRLLSDAVLEQRGEAVRERTDCLIDLPIRARLSEAYVPAAADRIALYKRFSALQNETEDADLREELQDRFGPLPEEAENLFLVAELRRSAAECGFEKVSVLDRTLAFFIPKPDEELCALFSALYGKRFFVSRGEHPRLNLRLEPGADLIDTLREFLFHDREFAKEKES